MTPHTSTTLIPAELLPHAGPMVLVDSIIQWDDSHIHCISQSHSQPANPLAINNTLSVYAGTEYAAQAIAIHARLTRPQKTGTPPPKGFLAVASKLIASVEFLHDIHVPLDIHAEQLAQTGKSSLYGFTLSASGTPLLTGQLMVITAGTE